MGKPDLVTGAKTDVSVDLKGSGASVRDLMAGLTGDLLLVLGEGKIDDKFWSTFWEQMSSRRSSRN